MTELFAQVTGALVPLSDPTRATAMSAYLRGQFPFLGVPTPLRRQAVTEVLKPLSTLDTALVHACFQAPEREYQYVACDHIRKVGITDLSLARDLVQDKSWWDTVDALAKPIGAAHDDEAMRAWARDENIWIRRVSIIHQLGRKNQTDRELLAWIISENLGSDEFFINKAIGWALRDLARYDPDWVREFSNATELAPLSRREALKHL